jgi:RNA polymerase sigma-70 factor (ECF subfamily)
MSVDERGHAERRQAALDHETSAVGTSADDPTAPGRSDELDVTRLLQAWRTGDAQARDELLSVVYEELKRQAASYMRRERRDHTLQPTALVHEAFLRLTRQHGVNWQNRAHFFAIAAQMMRRILVDHARERSAAKRPSPDQRASLDEDIASTLPPDVEVLMLDSALNELAALDARQAQIVELRYFGGLGEQEVAAALSVSRATVTREWQAARAWLYRRMTAASAVPGD